VPSISAAIVDEYVTDLAGNMFVDSSEINFTFSDGANTITADLIDASVTFARLQNVATARVLGRVTAGTGPIESLTATQATTLLNVFTSSLKGLVPPSGGSSTQYLSADGTFTTPPAGAPGGSTTQVQFNDAGAFGGDADFTWNKTTNTLLLGIAATPATIGAPLNAAGVGTVLNIIAGNSSNAGSAGGRLNINGGISTDGDGGLVQISAGAGVGTGRLGGGLNLVSGSGAAGNGGSVQVLCGSGTGSTRVGGSFTAGGGIGGAAGGSLNFNSGGCNGTGAAAVSGNVAFTTAAAASALGATGNITFTTGDAASNTGAGRASGSISLTCGASAATGTPGGVNLTAGALSSTNVSGITVAGAVSIAAGAGGAGAAGGAGGSVAITGGAAGTAAGTGGSISLTAADATSTVGAGSPAKNGGNITLTPGLAAGGGVAGALVLVNMTSVGAQTPTFAATNKPGAVGAGPALWMKVRVAGTDYYTPLWT
jgi:hypothetical protein